MSQQQNIYPKTETGDHGVGDEKFLNEGWRRRLELLGVKIFPKTFEQKSISNV